MRLLLDSHVVVWYLYDSHRLSAKTVKIIQTAEEVFVSSVSNWELAIKFSKSKFMHHPKELSALVDKAMLDRLELKQKHIEYLPQVNLPQKDPYDRMLTAQALSEELTIVTADKMLLNSSYPTLSA